MDAFFIEQCFEDASDGADGEVDAVVSVEDDGDFFLSVCWVLQADIEDELFFGFAPFFLVLVFSSSRGWKDSFVDVLDDFLVSVVCCLGESADLGAEFFVEALCFPFFPLLDFLQIWFFDGVLACALYFPISLFMPCLYAHVEHFIGGVVFFLCDHDCILCVFVCVDCC